MRVETMGGFMCILHGEALFLGGKSGRQMPYLAKSGVGREFPRETLSIICSKRQRKLIEERRAFEFCTPLIHSGRSASNLHKETY